MIAIRWSSIGERSLAERLVNSRRRESHHRSQSRSISFAPVVFSSVTFLFFFLPPVLLAYHAAPRAWRNGLLVAASLLFYAWGAGPFVVMLLASMAANYAIGLRIEWRV